MSDDNNEYGGKQALAELQNELGPDGVLACEHFCDNVIAPTLKQGHQGKALLGYLSIKIAALMEDW